ncbi:hypothetical protein [uncultured Ruegeria sp.]|uniref:hypothetical protein n=1 Tax=uncultured Ruegeria sp. TaxID=259304 RepID=UPI00261C3459|nr:hypothetical protein [uncultured Ruegeria sp.]
MTRRIEMRCTGCGSTDVRRDASAEWDPEVQDWVVVDTYDQSWCNSDKCDGADCFTEPFDIDTGEELREPPGSFKYIPKAKADALWAAESEEWMAECAARKEREKHEQHIGEIEEMFAAAH